MYTLYKRIMLTRKNKYLGFDIKDEDGNVKSMSKEDILKLAEDGLLKDVKLFYNNKLKGVNGFKVSSVKYRYVEDIEFDTLDSIVKVVEMDITTNNNSSKAKSLVKGKQNIEIRAIKIDKKLGRVSIITKVSNESYEKVFYLISVKHAKCDDLENVCFLTYLRNWLCRVMLLDFDKYTFTISRKVFNTLVYNKEVSKNFKVVGVDVFNIVHPNIHADLCEIYNFIVKYAKVV